MISSFNNVVLGFGKAVLEMALQFDEIIGSHVKKGIVSVPEGLVSQYKLSPQFLSRYTVCEGASNNIPDENALKATNLMENMVSKLSENDVLFVLISGQLSFKKIAKLKVILVLL